MRLVVHPMAQKELNGALSWSKKHFGASAAARLMARFEQAGEVLLREPAIGTPTAGAARKLPLGQLPYTIVYRVVGETITLLALAHQRRRPGYWRRR
jgi:toxin ParE1/3/4